VGCHEEGVRHRPIRSSAHGRVEGRPGEGANSGAYGGASDSCDGPGASDARGSACGGTNDGSNVQGPSGGVSRDTHMGYEEEKAGRRVASNGAHDNACGGTNGGCNGQGASGALTGGGGGSLKGGDGRNQGGSNDVGGG
jgi:hypothetical protein